MAVPFARVLPWQNYRAWGADGGEAKVKVKGKAKARLKGLYRVQVFQQVHNLLLI